MFVFVLLFPQKVIKMVCFYFPDLQFHSNHSKAVFPWM